MKKICGNCFSRISGNVCRKCGHVNVRTSADYDALPVGTQLRGRYTVGKLMGRGGFGMIYLAYDEQSDKTVAVKEFFPDGTAVRSQDNITAEPMTTIQQENYGEGLERFFREAEIISGFPECSELIGIYDVFRENGTAYYAMEFVHGASLKSYAETSSAISPAQAVYIAQKLLPSLQILHQRGVIHRDVSPDNIMLCADGSVKLIDFGSARYIQDRTCSMSVILKQGFAPLEQYQRRGAQGGWTDIYSFGASLLYAMTLVTPEDPLTRLEDDSDFEFQLHGITPSLAEILRRSCNVRRELRYQNAEEMLGAVSVCGVEPVGFPADKIQQAVRSSAAPEGSLARGGTFLSTAAAALTSAASSAAEFFSGISRTITPIKVRIGGEMFPVNSVELDLSDRELTNAQIINLRHMKRLKVLNLNYNYITDLACLEGLTQLMLTIRKVKQLYNPTLCILGILITMYNSRLNLSVQVLEEIKKYYADKLFPTPIPRSVKLTEAPSYGVPGVLFGIIGLILAIVGNKRSRNKGIGIAGLVCSIIAIIFGALASIYYISIIQAFGPLIQRVVNGEITYEEMMQELMQEYGTY